MRERQMVEVEYENGESIDRVPTRCERWEAKERERATPEYIYTWRTFHTI
jgi:hypothetical protein